MRAPGVPLVRSLSGYRVSWLKQDATAGVLVVALAVPLSMGMAEVAGMPPIAGLYSCVLPVAAYALLGSSRQLVIALDASTAAMLAAAVTPMAGSDPVAYAALAALATILVGVVLLLAGVVRLGFLGDFLSEPILLGYQAGLAVVVIASQLPKILGFDVDDPTTIGRLAASFTRIAEANLPTLVLGSGVLAIVLVVRARRPRVPGALIGILIATLLVELFDLGAEGIATLGRLPSGLPPIRVPAFGVEEVVRLLGPAGAIALVAAADTIVSSRAFAARNGYRVDASQDLIGLGAANLVSGLSGGITASASAARTAVVESVGSHSQVASVVAAGVMGVVLVFFTRPLRNVPVAALAAIVIAAVIRLIEPDHLRRLLRVRPAEFAVAAAAFLGVVFVGILEGVVLALILSVLDFVRRATRPHDAIVGRILGRHGSFDAARYPAAREDRGVLVYRFDAPLFSGNADTFRARAWLMIDEHPGTRWLVVDASAIVDVDATSARMLDALTEDLDRLHIRFAFVEVLARVHDLLDRYGLTRRIGVYDTVEDALSAFHHREVRSEALRDPGHPPWDRENSPPDDEDVDTRRRLTCASSR
jgi:high affinity sulfate transporter 1